MPALHVLSPSLGNAYTKFTFARNEYKLEFDWQGTGPCLSERNLFRAETEKPKHYTRNHWTIIFVCALLLLLSTNGTHAKMPNSTASLLTCQLLFFPCTRFGRTFVFVQSLKNFFTKFWLSSMVEWLCLAYPITFLRMPNCGFHLLLRMSP